MNLLLLGISHHTAGLALRESLAVDELDPVLGKLVAEPEIEEAVVVSTCNRVEVMALTREAPAARLRLRHFFANELAGGRPIDVSELEEALYTHEDRAAVRHAFRVASSVDSLVVGEPQILGQVKDAYRGAVECGACGPVLGRLYQRAFATAKRVRNETRIAERPVSVARVGVDLATQIFESLEDKSALLIGAGDMTELALEALHSQGLARIRVANRTRERAVALAGRFQAEAHALDALPRILPLSDVVLTSIGGAAPILTEPVMREALRTRRGRPIFVIDLGVPRNVDPAVDRLDQVYRYDLDDLSQVAATNAEERRREVELAEAIVAEEEQRFDGWLAALSAVPTIRNLRARAERIRQAELERHLTRLDLDAAQGEQVEALTRAIVNKLLHAPLSRLRAEVEREQGLAILEVARSLFALDDPEAPGADDQPSDESLDEPQDEL
ncbi:MAG: glutamyl-tRNA reductase [Myxococcota bacterium]|nr:glutamyl-tRNA reductase [Myxococcota bacterium]